MIVTTSFKHLEHTPAIDRRIREKSKHFKKYLEGESYVKWTCWIEDTIPRMHVAQVHVHAPKCNFMVTARSENLYKCLDEAVDKMEKQLRKHKEKSKDHLHVEHDEVVIRDPAQAWESYPDVAWGEFEKPISKDHMLE